MIVEWYFFSNLGENGFVCQVRFESEPNVTWVLEYQPQINNISYINTRLPKLLALKTSESTKPKVPKGSKGSKEPQNPKEPKDLNDFKDFKAKS